MATTLRMSDALTIIRAVPKQQCEAPWIVVGKTKVSLKNRRISSKSVVKKLK